MTMPTRKITWRVNRAILRHLHQALRHRIREVQVEADDGFARSFDHLVATVEAGLRHEETLLEALGDQHLRERRAENAIILRALHRVAPTVEQGQVEPGRQIAAALEEMLALHRLSSIPAAQRSPGSCRPRGLVPGSRIRALAGRTRQFH